MSARWHLLPIEAGQVDLQQALVAGEPCLRAERMEATVAEMILHDRSIFRVEKPRGLDCATRAPAVETGALPIDRYQAIVGGSESTEFFIANARFVQLGAAIHELNRSRCLGVQPRKVASGNLDDAPCLSEFCFHNGLGSRTVEAQKGIPTSPECVVRFKCEDRLACKSRSQFGE